MRNNRSGYIPLAVRIFLSVFLLLLLLFGLLFGTLMGLLHKEILQIETRSMQRQVEQLDRMLDQIFAAQLKKGDSLLSNREFIALLSGSGDNPAQRVMARTNLERILSRAEMEYSYGKGRQIYQIVPEFTVFTDNPYLIPSAYSEGTLDDILRLDDMKDTEWYQDLVEEGNGFVWDGVRTLFQTGYMTGYRRIVDPDTLEMVGVLRLSIPLSGLEKVMEWSVGGEETRLYYLTTQGNVLFSFGGLPDSEALRVQISAFSEGGAAAVRDGVFLCGSVSDFTKNQIVYAFSENLILHEFHRFSTLFAYAMCLIFFCAVPVIFVLSRWFTRRIRVLVEKTERLSEGCFDVTQHVHGNDELTELDRHFDQMVERLKELIERDARFQIQEEEMKIELLQEQINPHLLYNTLSFIRYEAKKSGMADTALIANNLIVFYRRFLNEGDYIASIDSELMMLVQYVEVTRAVYKLELCLRVDVPEDIRELYAVKLFLQPLAENAILHGIRPMDGGTLTVSARREKGDVVFDITDDGCGMEKEELAEIMECLSGEKPREQMRTVGLYNVSRRLRLLYGETYGITIESVSGEGTSVHIRIPAMNEEECRRLNEQRAPGRNNAEKRSDSQ